MKTMRERLKPRTQPDRPMITISLRRPEDVIEDLKKIAPMLGFTGCQPLMRSYIGQGLRKDLQHLHLFSNCYTVSSRPEQTIFSSAQRRDPQPARTTCTP